MVWEASVPMEKVWTPVEVDVTIVKERPPEVEVASVCDATELPSREVIVPPAPPASVPQKKLPPFHRSFSVEALQEERDAPKREASERDPVEVALPK